jgi:hypothetical protein
MWVHAKQWLNTHVKVTREKVDHNSILVLRIHTQYVSEKEAESRGALCNDKPVI